MRRFFLCAALLALPPGPVAAQPRPSIRAEDLRRHVEVLASDAFLGRKPGTEGETMTLAYIASQWDAAGLQPAIGESWYQPVPLAERRPHGHRALWSANGRPISFDQRSIVLLGAEPVMTLRGAPVIFAGHGVRQPERGIDQLAGADLTGAVVLILYQGPPVEGFPSFAERVASVAAAGAAAVIGVVEEDIPWSRIVDTFSAGQNRLQAERTAPIQGAMPIPAVAELVRRAGGDMAALLNVGGAEFKAVALPLRVSLDVSTAVHRYTSYNVVGRISGTGATGESVLFLAHWDHLGVCRPEAADKICNGAVDNASGIAVLTEVARGLAAGPRPKRDILFLATTAEEIGLLGASAFAADPPVPLASIVAALNIDTIGLTPAGEPVAMIGRGTTGIDPLLDQVAAELGRRVDIDKEADLLMARQDGWVLTRAGIPSVVIQGALSDLAKMGTYLSGDYHEPSDDLAGPLVLEGAAEDAELMVTLARKLADPALYSRAQR